MLIASTWIVLAGISTAAGSSRLACPENAGEITMKPSGTASSASVRRPNRGGANPVAPTDAGRSTGRRAVDSTPSSTAPSPIHTRILMPQTVPKRVSSTSPMIWLSSADQKETPAAVAPCSTMPAMPLNTPASTARSSAVRAPDAKRSEASRHWPLPPATSASAGSQTAIRKKIVPTAIAIEVYWTPRATPNATWVTSPTLPCCESSSETVAPVVVALP